MTCYKKLRHNLAKRSNKLGMDKKNKSNFSINILCHFIKVLQIDVITIGNRDNGNKRHT
jgi:hypothetical protein